VKGDHGLASAASLIGMQKDEFIRRIVGSIGINKSYGIARLNFNRTGGCQVSSPRKRVSLSSEVPQGVVYVQVLSVVSSV